MRDPSPAELEELCPCFLPAAMEHKTVEIQTAAVEAGGAGAEAGGAEANLVSFRLLRFKFFSSRNLKMHQMQVATCALSQGREEQRTLT